MKEIPGYAWPHGCSAATRWLSGGRRWLLLIALLVGAGAVAAVLAPTPTPTYCSASACYDTLDKAEAALRSGTAYNGANALLEHMDTGQLNSTTLRMQYWLRKRPADLVRAPSYFANYGSHGNSTGACTVGDDQAALPGWCADLGALVTLAQTRIQAARPGCTVTGTAISTAFSVPGMEASTSERGIVNYGLAWYRTSGTCINGSTWSELWSVAKKRPLYCRTGFRPIFATVNDATLAQDNVCEGQNRDVAYINVPIQQCGSCAGSRNPVYPATGEKQRHEDDFTFAGQAFTRHYRSLRQFRNNASFAVAWNHTWSDRIITGPSTNTPYVHLDETGSYESYTLLSGNRYRGENSVDRLLERVNANGIGWRLRMPDGEVNDFNLSGYLIAVRNPSTPLNDIVLAYASDKSLSTVTDAQGRVLRFMYEHNLLRRIELPDGMAVAYSYDTNLNLTGVTYPGGKHKQYHYNEAGLTGAANQRHHLTGITAEDERRFASFGYDARGRVISSRVLGTPNELTTVAYPTEDNAVVGTAEGDSRTYTIEPGVYRRILDAADSIGTEVQTFYPDGRLWTSTDKRDIVTQHEYTADYRSATITAVGKPEQRREEVMRDPTTRLVSERLVLDASGALQAKTTWTYNARNQVLAVTATDPTTSAVRTVVTTYCEASDVTAGVCPLVGLVTSITAPRADTGGRPGPQNVVTFSYRMADEPNCAASPAVCPYRKGDAWKAVNALGHTVERLRNDGAGRPLSVRDANGIVTDFEYDPRGRLIVSTIRGSDDNSEADDRTTRIEYDATGTVHRVTLPDGAFTQFEYDAAQRLTAMTDALGNRMAYTLTAAGEREREETRDPSGALMRSLSRTFDTLGRLDRQTDAYQKATTFLYDKEDNLSLTTDALNHKTANDFDALGRLKATLQDVDGVAALTQFEYDALDRATRIVDPNGLATEYTYSGFGDVLSLQSPDTGTTTSTYDGAGNLKTRTDARGITATYRYDLLSRVIGVDYPDSSRNIAFAYDTPPEDCPNGEQFAKGRLAAMTDASGSTGYCYDRYGNVSRKLQLTLGRSYALRYLHTDPRGWLPNQSAPVQNPPPGNQMIGMTYPDGSGVRIVRDAQSRPTELRVTLANGQAKVLLSAATYYPFGPVSRWTFGNGRTLRRVLNENYQPDAIEDAAAGGISEGYTFDAAGNLESLRKADQLLPARRTYRYDGLNRLTHVRDGASNTLLNEYAYDATGNRTRRTDGGTTTPYSYAPARHLLTSIGVQGRQYDSVGNTTRIEMTPGSGGGDTPPGGGEPTPGPGDPPPGESQSMGFVSTAAAAMPTVREFDYDDTNRMRAVKHDDTVVMRYLYNGKGERVHKAGSGIAVTTVYDEAGKWIGDYDANGQPLQQAVWLDNLPVGLLVGAGASQKLYYIEADALGTPRVVIDPDRNVAVWRWDLAGEAFGDSLPMEDVDGDGIAFVFDMRFPGQRYDGATGLSYNYFRDYDAGVGRYVQSDPIGLAGGISTYGYVSGNPLATVDYFGLDGIRIDRQQMYDIGARHGKIALAGKILLEHWIALGKKDVPGADQFYHCLASCKATQATGSPDIVLSLLEGKEDFDLFRHTRGGYRDDIKTISQMRADMAKDMDVNRFGAACEDGEDCVKRCKHLLNAVEQKYRQYLTEFRPEWRAK